MCTICRAGNGPGVGVRDWVPEDREGPVLSLWVLVAPLGLRTLVSAQQ